MGDTTLGISKDNLIRYFSYGFKLHVGVRTEGLVRSDHVDAWCLPVPAFGLCAEPTQRPVGDDALSDAHLIGFLGSREWLHEWQGNLIFAYICIFARQGWVKTHL